MPSVPALSSSSTLPMLPRRRRCYNDQPSICHGGGILNLTATIDAVILLLLTMVCVWYDSSSSIFVCDATDTARIVGGSSAMIGEYPYFVNMDGCGGVLVSPSVVLTAAHCGNKTDTTVIVGAYYKENNKNNREESGAVVRHCARWIEDPTWQYNVVTLEDKESIVFPLGTKRPPFTNDFAVCILDTPVYQNGLLPIILNPDPDVPFASKKAHVTVIGLGQISSNGGGQPAELLEVTNPVIENADCQRRYAASYLDASTVAANTTTTPTTETTTTYINDSDLCSGSFQKDACSGDSGGPLILKDNKTTRHYLVGIVSWGRSCGSNENPGVYSRISSRYDWIQSMIPTSDFADDGCDGIDGQLLEVQIYTDDYAEDTSFTVTDETIHPGDDAATGAVLLEASNLQYNNKRYKYSTCLPTNTCYKFQIKDAYDDGLTTYPLSGKQRWSQLKLNGTVLLKGGNYADQDSYEGCVDTTATDTLIGGKLLEIYVKTDRYDVTSYRLFDETANKLLLKRSMYKRQRHKDSIYLPGGTCFEFTIYNEDGLGPSGFYKLSLDGELVVRRGDGGDSSSSSGTLDSTHTDRICIAPRTIPSTVPSDLPSVQPSTLLSDLPSTEPSKPPSTIPSTVPGDLLSVQPSTLPSDPPSDTKKEKKKSKKSKK